MARSVAPIGFTPSEVLRTVLGGVVAAPVIGVLVGGLSRRFARLGLSARIAVALANLSLAVWLFLVAAGVANLLDGRGAWSRSLVSEPIRGTLFGLTYTGFVLVLWPLSYVNHVMVGRMWRRV